MTLRLVVLLTLGSSVEGLRSRARGEQHRPTTKVTARRRCNDKAHSASFLSAGNASFELAGELTGYIFADGYSRVACETDIAPEKVRINFKEHACGKVGGTCRLTELAMQPRLCFDFCRQYQEVHFFGLKNGRDCYCATYFTPHTTGGGECNAQCEGDNKEMCGGMEKSSLFEMHMCGDSSSEADLALDMSTAAAGAALQAATAANATAIALRSMADAWQLGVCSVAPEGPRVCSLNSAWLKLAGEATDAAAEATHAASVLAAKSQELTTFKTNSDAAGNKTNASLASNVELTTGAVRDAASHTKGTAAGVNVTLKTLAGPLLGRKLDAFTEAFVHVGVSNASVGWSTICGLEVLSGQTFAAVAADDPSTCADRCLSKSVGIDGCVGFNYQYKGGLAACQLLSSTGLVQPMLAKAVPVFEVSDSKRDAMGFTSIGCYCHHAFLAGHPRGPLKTEVIREIALDLQKPT